MSRFRQLFDQYNFSSRFLEDTSEAVVITDVDANIIEVNQALERMTGYRREEGCNVLQGYHFSQPLPADEFEEFLRRQSA